MMGVSGYNPIVSQGRSVLCLTIILGLFSPNCSPPHPTLKSSKWPPDHSRSCAWLLSVKWPLKPSSCVVGGFHLPNLPAAFLSNFPGSQSNLTFPLIALGFKRLPFGTTAGNCLPFERRAFQRPRRGSPPVLPPAACLQRPLTQSLNKRPALIERKKEEELC